jgi:hypothetical protein
MPGLGAPFAFLKAVEGCVGRVAILGHLDGTKRSDVERSIHGKKG